MPPQLPKATVLFMHLVQLFIDPVSKKTYKLTADVKVGTAIYRGGAEKPTADQAAAKAAQKAAMEDRAARQKAAAEQKKK